jgi:hypothetical protein
MTNREHVLLRLLVISFVSVGVLLGISGYLDALVRMDSEFSSLQKQSLRIQRQVVDQQTPQHQNLGFDPATRFWDAGKLPEPTVLAAKLQPILEGQGVKILGLQVVESTTKTLSLQYSLEAPMGRFMAAFAQARGTDSHLVIKKFVSVLKEKGIYGISWEVGYATAP